MRSFVLALLLAACSDQEFVEDPDEVDVGDEDTDTFTHGDDVIGDADTDADSDSDSDADADADSDADSDADADADTDLNDVDDDTFCLEASNTAGYLDPYQTADDGKVWLCHKEGGSYTLVNISNDACLTHISHEDDVLPTTVCDT